ncbi:FecR domain-containing protein [Aureimonas phyllosphaerae]|uniref:FecR domain-containing protein n=1 Tax=Aureimonas phyllosphaerae TaxID=1166078 RepID=UPI003A5C4774
MRARFLTLLLLFLALVHADVGWAREWRVERVSGTAWAMESNEKRDVLTTGMIVPEGRTIATAKASRVRLSSENNVMTLGPGSVAMVQPKGFFSSKTEVLQQTGSIAFDIEKRSAPHFTVKTPFMAAVVKGTAFTISVTRTDTKIGVDRGLVQVSDLKTGETAGIGAGQRASVSAATSGLRTAGVNAPGVTPGKPAAPSVAPVGQALQSFRAAQAPEPARSSAVSTSRDAAASTHGTANGTGASRSSDAAGSGGFGGADSNGRDRQSIGSSVAETNAPSGETASRSAASSESLGGGASPAGTGGAGTGGNGFGGTAGTGTSDGRPGGNTAGQPSQGGPQAGAPAGGPGAGGSDKGGPDKAGPGKGGPGHDGPGMGGPDKGGPDKDGPETGGPAAGGPGRDGPGHGPDKGGPGAAGPNGGADKGNPGKDSPKDNNGNGNGGGNNGNGKGNGGPNGDGAPGNGKGNNGKGLGNGGPKGALGSDKGNNGNGHGPSGFGGSTK